MAIKLIWIILAEMIEMVLKLVMYMVISKIYTQLALIILCIICVFLIHAYSYAKSVPKHLAGKRLTNFCRCISN